jgi:glycosyltransferase involved in cell wall biosynthesis
MKMTAPSEWRGVRILPYQLARGSTPKIHPWVTDIESKTIRGEAAFHAACKLREQGFIPDAIIAHPGWGESLFLKDVWPDSALGIYCEYFYRSRGADIGFDPEFPDNGPAEVCRLRLKNFNNLLHFDTAAAGLSPTQWQASTFPDRFRERITVIHDGINTPEVAPNPGAALTVKTTLGERTFTRRDEIVTFVNRNLEPCRGYHQFMRALPELQQRRPHAHTLIVGGDEVGYGARPPGGRSWKRIFFDEIKDRIDLSRVHFIGRILYPQFLALLQVSTVHAYLTYPFVLSWSLLEAMSTGCAIVASDTAPLREAIRHGETGQLVDFFSPQELALETARLLGDAAERARLGANARAFAMANYDLKTVCLPRQIEWVHALVRRRAASVCRW